MRIIHTVTSMHVRNGGPTRTISALCTELGQAGENVSLICYNDDVPEQNNYPSKDVAEVIAVSASNLILRPCAFYRAVCSVVTSDRTNLIHDHGVWNSSNVATCLAARTHRVPLVVTTRGMLEPWALKYKATKKQLAWWFYQRRSLKYASVLHATSDMEAVGLRALGLRAPIAVIPNGVNVPPDPVRASKSNRPRTALFLSRIHPKKGLFNLVTAWEKVRPSGWRLLIVGPDEGGHRAEVAAHVEKEGLKDSITFYDAVNDKEKWTLYGEADLFILPTYSENFGVVVAEALAAGVPVLTTRGTPWQVLEAERCGWWVDVGVEPLTKALYEATMLADDMRDRMGRRGRALVEERFTWPKVAAQMRKVYEWVLGERGVPECVRLN